jgi:hypothetical protein
MPVMPTIMPAYSARPYVENPCYAAVLGVAVKADPSLAERTGGDKQGRRAIDHAHPDCMRAMRAAGPCNPPFPVRLDFPPSWLSLKSHLH